MKQLPSLFILLASLFLTSEGISQSPKADPPKGPERWNGSMAEFAARDQNSPPKDGTILFVGSSSIRMWDLETSWPERATTNNGFGGSTLADAIHHFDRLFLPYRPSAIVLYAGDNDIAKKLTPAQVSKDFRTLASLISNAHPDIPVVFIAIKPSRARWEMWPKMKQANDLIASQCRELEHYRFADIAAPMLEGAEGAPSDDWFLNDGLHLSKSGYARWTALIKTILAGNSGGK